MENIKDLNVALAKEIERIEEIVRLIDISWDDPGAELIKKKLLGQMQKLDEQAQILRDKILKEKGKGGSTEKGIWQEEEEQKQGG
jgi:hypothetical protein